MRDLAAHLGQVWAMATTLITTRASSFTPPGAEADAPEPDDRMVAWLDERRTALLTALRQLAPEDSVWGWWSRHDGAFYLRRMAVETMTHRWDAAQALGRPAALDRDLSVDGIDELLEVGLTHYLHRGDRAFPTGSLHLHCTDGEGEWLVQVVGDQLVVRHEHAKGDAAMRGPAASLFLRMWGRSAPDVEVLGDTATAEAWAALAP